MKPNLQLFDVDGTLTWSEKDEPYATAHEMNYHTFSFWSLLFTLLARDVTAFHQALRAWDESMRTASQAEKDRSSFDMMQRTLDEFLLPSVTGAVLEDTAAEITRVFLQHGVVQLEAIQYLQACLEHDIICVLTTGSYLDGLHGFVRVLIEEGHLQASPNLWLNGAEIDWSTRTLLRANVGQYKMENLIATLQKITLPITLLLNCAKQQKFLDCPNCRCECRMIFH